MDSSVRQGCQGGEILVNDLVGEAYGKLVWYATIFLSSLPPDVAHNATVHTIGPCRTQTSFRGPAFLHGLQNGRSF